jgi:hypothetical protein
VGLSNPISIYKSIVSERRKKSCCYLTEYNLEENASEANWFDWFLVIKKHGPTAWQIYSRTEWGFSEILRGTGRLSWKRQ